MSWLSQRTGIHVGPKQFGSLGGALLGTMIPGVGTLAGMALGSGLGRAAGGLASGENVGQAALHGFGTGAGVYGGGKVLGMIPGVNKLPGLAGAEGAPAAPPPANYSNLFQNEVVDPMAARLGGGGGASGLASGVGHVLKDNAGALINAGGGAFSAVSEAQQQAANRDFMQSQFDFQKQQVLRQNQLEDEQRRRQLALGQQWLQGMSSSNPQNPQVQAILRAMGY